MEEETRKLIEEAKELQSEKVVKVEPWKEQILKTERGSIRSNSSKNVYLILKNDARLKDLLQYNEFSEQLQKVKPNAKLETKPGDWLDSDDSKLRLFIESNYNYVPTKDAISDAVVNFAMDNTFNPVKQRIESVEWDGKPRVETFFIDYLGTEDTEYVREITKRWVTGAVARVYDPGVKFEIVPILFGGQGIGKSTLVGSIYRDYFLDELSSMGKTKDDFQQILGRWIVEIGELSAMRKTDVDHVKMFVSAQSDLYRPSYGKYTTAHPRKVAFIGTSNPPEFLKDKSGNRRFFPIECNVQEKKKDPFNIDDADILQILAEAKTLYDNGQEIHVPDSLQKIAESYQKNAMVQDPTEEQIISFLDMPVPLDWNRYDLESKRIYFTRYQNNQGCIDKDSHKQVADTTSLTQVTTNDILQVAFHINDNQLISASKGNVGKQISDVMNGLQDTWQRDNHVKVNGKNKRGYKRK